MTLSDRSNSGQRRHQRTVYLDCNATTLTHPLALKAAREAMELCYGNPSSTHITGLHAKSFLENARDAAMVAVGAASSEEIIFNSGATEGIQSAIFSVLNHLVQTQRTEKSKGNARFRMLYGSTEHKAVPAALHHWAQILNAPVTIEAIPVDEKGLLDCSFIAERLHETALLCTMAVNNETGVVQPLQPLSELLKTSAGQGCLWFVDGVQALGKMKLQLDSLGADYACFSGHKLNAPKGIGFLYVRSGVPFTPLIVGGGQERGMRSGTENLPGAAAFGKILQALNEERPGVFLKHQELVDCQRKLIETLRSCFPTLVWNVDLSLCVPTTLNFSVEGVSSRELMNAFDAAGVRVSGGSACSSGKVSESHVLSAMHLHSWRAQNAIRLSFGPGNTIEEIDEACEALKAAGEALRASCMIPNLPARTDQALQIIQNMGHGISELRSSQGTRAWLMSPADPNTADSYLVADCDKALNELQNKLACRGLARSKVLVLDPKTQQSLPAGWLQIETEAGRTLIFTDARYTSSPIVFCSSRPCLKLVLREPEAQSVLQSRVVLVCFADESTPLSAYELLEWPRAIPNITNNSSAGAQATQTSPTDTPKFNSESQVECTREALMAQLRHKKFLVLDVREPFESATSHLDEILMELLGNKTTRKIAQERKSHIDFDVVPLSRLPQFLIECIEKQTTLEILCVCRSGQRSLQAAELLRRLTLCKAYSLKGGLAALLAPEVSLAPRKTNPPPHAED
jgi:cysteine sulfinate desulfinase/cysteine desulfurase-like protein/rhodanese-related sulfurtransferase